MIDVAAFKRFMQKNGISQTEVSRQCSIQQATVSRILQGKDVSRVAEKKMTDFMADRRISYQRFAIFMFCEEDPAGTAYQFAELYQSTALAQIAMFKDVAISEEIEIAGIKFSDMEIRERVMLGSLFERQVYVLYGRVYIISCVHEE